MNEKGYFILFVLIILRVFISLDFGFRPDLGNTGVF